MSELVDELMSEAPMFKPRAVVYPKTGLPSKFVALSIAHACKRMQEEDPNIAGDFFVIDVKMAAWQEVCIALRRRGLVAELASEGSGTAAIHIQFPS